MSDTLRFGGRPDDALAIFLRTQLGVNSMFNRAHRGVAVAVAGLLPRRVSDSWLRQCRRLRRLDPTVFDPRLAANVERIA